MPEESGQGSKTYEQSINKSTISYNNALLANSYTIKRFDFKDYKDTKNLLITITSKRRTGKSVLLKNLCYTARNWYKRVYVFSMTAHLQPDLFDFLDPEDITHGFDEEKLNGLWSVQEKAFKDLGKEKLPHTLVILDDVISDPNFKKSQMMLKLAVMGRHLNFCVVILSQNFTSIPPAVRNNVDIAIAFYLDSYVNREQFSKSYISTKNTKVGMLLFEKITRVPYQAIIVQNNIISSNPEEYIKSFISDLNVPSFKMGSRKVNINKSISLFVDRNFPSSLLGTTDFMPPIRKE